MIIKNILKNFIFVAFVAFIFSVSFNFVSADSSCECKVTSTTPYSALSNCITGNIVSTTTCSVGSAAGGPTPKGDCVCIARGTGGLVPCTNDCTADDLFGTAGSYASNPPIWSSLIRTALGISGIFILLMFVLGGVMIIVSRGDKAKIKKATDIMKNSIIGLLIVIFAYTFVKFIVIALVNEKWTLFFGGQ